MTTIHVVSRTLGALSVPVEAWYDRTKARDRSDELDREVKNYGMASGKVTHRVDSVQIRDVIHFEREG